jgi:hypothetical protein
MNNSLIDHPLIGTWVAGDEDSDVAFGISTDGDTFQVSGFSISSGALFKISDVMWDGKALSFVARFPSTNTVTRNVLRPQSADAVTLKLTIHEVWIRKEVKLGQLPSAWRRRLNERSG